MAAQDLTPLQTLVLALVPPDGVTVGNATLRKQGVAQAAAAGMPASEDEVEAARQALIAAGLLQKGRGRGGSVFRADGDGTSFDLQSPVAASTPPRDGTSKVRRQARKKSAKGADSGQILSYRHADRRRNNPEVGMVDDRSDPPEPKTTWRYDPHLAPELQFEPGRAGIERLIDDALADDDPAALRAAPFENLPLRDAIDFYRHDKGWSNRLVAGDSLLVMNSLLQKEGMAGQVQTIYLDPPYGSGTTAFVAEKWGRRWVTCDTSRVAVTLARQRLLTASYDYYDLRYPHEGLKSGFIYKTVPHVTLKSIANNPEIDEIHARMHPTIEAALDSLNTALTVGGPPSGRSSVEESRRGRRSYKDGSAGAGLQEWEVPFDFPDDWPEAARAPFYAFHAARRTRRGAAGAVLRHRQPAVPGRRQPEGRGQDRRRPRYRVAEGDIAR
jgi:hypothetical protein